ncbi:fungal Zn binuclear cluster domain-containing protein [Sesbania bispinosa]|nr:fungal Zn binuclear cluster domain-containing protein [Sesbania bispinosa]
MANPPLCNTVGGHLRHESSCRLFHSSSSVSPFTITDVAPSFLFLHLFQLALVIEPLHHWRNLTASR